MGTYSKIPEVESFKVSAELEALREKYRVRDTDFQDSVMGLIASAMAKRAEESEKTAMSKTYFWRRGEIAFQPKCYKMDGMFEGKKTPVFEVEPGSAYRVVSSPIEGREYELFIITEHPLFIPIGECEPVEPSLQAAYDAKNGV